MKKISLYMLIGIAVLALVFLNSSKFGSTKEISEYEVVILRSTSYDEVPMKTLYGVSLLPGQAMKLGEDLQSVVRGEILGGYKGAHEQIKGQLSIDVEEKVTLVSEKGMRIANTLTEGGEHEAGYMAQVGHFAHYDVQMGYVYPKYSDSTQGESKFFVAIQPTKVWADLIPGLDYDPEEM